jgi:hypothetical protein
MMPQVNSAILLTCNSCGGSLDGNCYRTKCQHLYCEACAGRAFSKGTLCSICGSKLHEGEVREVMIGIAPLPLLDSLFQTAFQTTNWQAILENSFHIMSGAIEVSLFIQHQLFLESTKKNEAIIEMTRRVENVVDEKVETSHIGKYSYYYQAKLSIQLRNEISLSNQRSRELEHHVQMREKELCELKEAYGEKLKKCDAWEKVWHNCPSTRKDKCVIRLIIPCEGMPGQKNVSLAHGKTLKYKVLTFLIIFLTTSKTYRESDRPSR